ncbi:MAG: hypothetical protein KatS3mg110_2993 [Pirellulaceae bacterium]|nr:MAG: hypothetical protein KatS3mg110_2993 [Pirellulaceae bacterium]
MVRMAALTVLLLVWTGTLVGQQPGANSVPQATALQPEMPQPQAAVQPAGPAAPVRGLLELPPRLPRAIPGVPGDWRQPAYGEQRVSDQARRFWVRLTPNGNLIGRVVVYDASGNLVAAANVTLRFLQSGRIIAETFTDAEGVFLTTLVPGVYSVIGFGDVGVFAAALTVLPAARGTAPAAGEEAPAEAAAELAVEMAAFPAPLGTLRAVLQRYYPEMVVPVVEESSYTVPAQAQPGERIQQFGLRDWLSAAEQEQLRDLVKRLKPATSVQTHAVPITPDGRLRGRAIGIDPVTGRPVLIRQAAIFLVKNDEVVARGIVDGMGVFDIEGVQPGQYGLAVAGRDGFGAMGVNLVTMATRADLASDPNSYYVAAQQGELDTLTLSLVTDPRDVQQGLSGQGPPVGGGGPPPPPPPPGGGGGGGGGGGEPPLLSAVGAAIAAGALSTSDQAGSPPGP